MSRITGILVGALLVLATVWAYNRFSGKTIATLGAKAAA
jgi:hypothetical protein